MKGLYKAIKSPETNLLRPYRDKPLEIRPHLRRAEWRDLWIGPQQDGGPLQSMPKSDQSGWMVGSSDPSCLLLQTQAVFLMLTGISI